jgi:hypothetical protein
LNHGWNTNLRFVERESEATQLDSTKPTAPTDRLNNFCGIEFDNQFSQIPVWTAAPWKSGAEKDGAP